MFHNSSADPSLSVFDELEAVEAVNEAGFHFYTVDTSQDPEAAAEVSASFEAAVEVHSEPCNYPAGWLYGASSCFQLDSGYRHWYVMLYSFGGRASQLACHCTVRRRNQAAFPQAAADSIPFIP